MRPVGLLSLFLHFSLASNCISVELFNAHTKHCLAYAMIMAHASGVMRVTVAYLFISNPSRCLMDNCWRRSFEVCHRCLQFGQMGRIGLKRIDLQLTLKRLVFLYERSDAVPSA